MASSSLASLNTPERRSLCEEAGKAADEFHRLYYETLQKKPHRVSQMYLDNAVLIWDGNPFVNASAIKTFYENMPTLTFKIMTMDVQPVAREAVGGQKTVMVTIAGNYRISGVGERNFYQTFLITANADNKWKIASDVFRSQKDPE